MSDPRLQDDLDGCLPKLVENLRRRHPELVAGLDVPTICQRFLCFHGEHEMTPEALRGHLRGERGEPPDPAAPDGQ